MNPSDMLTFLAYSVGYTILGLSALWVLAVASLYTFEGLQKPLERIGWSVHNEMLILRFLLWRAVRRREVARIEEVENAIAKAKAYDSVVAQLESQLEALLAAHETPNESYLTWDQAAAGARQLLESPERSTRKRKFPVRPVAKSQRG